MLEKLSEIDQRFEKLTELLIQPETVADQQQFRTLSREHSELQEIVTAYRRYQKISQSLEENQLIADDASEDTELRDLAREEIQELEVQSKDLTQQLEFEPLKLHILGKHVSPLVQQHGVSQMHQVVPLNGWPACF